MTPSYSEVSEYRGAAWDQFILTLKKEEKKGRKELVCSKTIWSHSKIKKTHYRTPKSPSDRHYSTVSMNIFHPQEYVAVLMPHLLK